MLTGPMKSYVIQNTACEAVPRGLDIGLNSLAALGATPSAIAVAHTTHRPREAVPVPVPVSY